jgi:23S rRNA pseudouridine1911/1915/1917 synthase
VIVIDEPAATAREITAESIPLAVVYEDEYFLVVDKPAGMVVHPAPGNWSGTLVNALMGRGGELAPGASPDRAGIVHRLDKETSGLVIIAKNDIAHRKLSEQFSGREINKRYIALVHGGPKADTGTVNAPVSRDQSQRTRMTTKGYGGRDAISHYTVLERFSSPYGKFALIEVKIETGRTHQIRVHMSSIGHPVVGDTLYGAPAALSSATRDREGRGTSISTRNEAKKLAARKQPSATSKTLSLTRNFLHAAAIEFTHPTNKKPLSFARDIPQELADFLAKLKEDSTAGPALAVTQGASSRRK